jgi:hypothetical protein
MQVIRKGHQGQTFSEFPRTMRRCYSDGPLDKLWNLWPRDTPTPAERLRHEPFSELLRAAGADGFSYRGARWVGAGSYVRAVLPVRLLAHLPWAQSLRISNDPAQLSDSTWLSCFQSYTVKGMACALFRCGCRREKFLGL